MRKKSGTYHLQRYNKYSAKKKTLEFPNYMTAMAAGRKYLKKNPNGSAVVYLIMYNTLEHK